MTVLIEGSPEVMAFTVHAEKDLVEVPLITWPGMPATKLIGNSLPEVVASFAKGFVGHHNSVRKEQFFDVPIAQAEAEVELDPMADDRGWEPMVFVEIG